ncbi:MAG: ATPase, T2SS/T4P/T4SS family, partial [Acidobacteria bacterium]|nr:ATPase, T2SS/T4P/T4SS family [Acidobacteriota bacterium]MDW7985376.1 ATPase, T2SS/T4P/T4SS family [Acidobacteriota bacterium]
MPSDKDLYVVTCFNCTAEFEAVEAAWCSHDPQNPTKICPYCLQCFCEAPLEYVQKFWQDAPISLRQEHESFRSTRHPLGNLLVQSGLLTLEQVAVALAEQRRTNERLGEVFVRLGHLTAAELEYFLKLQDFRLPQPLRPEHVYREALNKLTPTFCLQNWLVPIALDTVGKRRFLVVATVHRIQPEVMEEIREQLLAHPVPFLCEAADVLRALRPFMTASAPVETAATLDSAADARRWFTQLLKMATARNATEIYIEPGPWEISVRLRIDGVLYKSQGLALSAGAALFDYIRQFARLSPAVSGTPQNAVLDLKLQGQPYRLQFHILPGTRGDHVDIRIIHTGRFLRPLERIGFLPAQWDQVQAALARSQGLVVVSSPPMHGAITTGYAILHYLCQARRRVAIIETVVRYPLAGAIHLTVDLGKQQDILAFVREAQARQVDVVYLEAMPGPETARAVLEASAERLCIAEANANSVWGVLHWLRELAIDAPTTAQRLNLILNQRLVRKVCDVCVREASIRPELWTRMG